MGGYASHAKNAGTITTGLVCWQPLCTAQYCLPKVIDTASFNALGRHGTSLGDQYGPRATTRPYQKLIAPIITRNLGLQDKEGNETYKIV